ncbi:beta-galactosidase [bacterium]|nr:beta-galactosidase [bacterium]
MTKTWQPKPGRLMTSWASQVSPENVHPEYPRPQMRRTAWMHLNGLWQYAITRKEEPKPDKFEGKILVPFPVESALSGVMRPLQPNQLLWYRRTFHLPQEWLGQRIFLHFGAVDWETTIWLNGEKLGSHRGGYTPFSFELTEVLSTGENELVLSVWDPTDAHGQQRGKQALNPGGIWYTASSGIWQTVWLEPVPEDHIDSFTLLPQYDEQELHVHLETGGTGDAESVTLRVRDGDKTITTVTGLAGEFFSLQLPNFTPWSPEDPHLYDLTLTLCDAAGTPIDTVESYFGMRKFSLDKDAQGNTRFCLNNAPYFQYGLLDQGYWPDGLHTAPTDEALRSDLEQIKALGLNMVRKHVKIEPARYYYHCDRLGLIVWQDMVNGGNPVGYVRSFTENFVSLPHSDEGHHTRSGRADEESRRDFNAELNQMIASLYNTVSIGMWVLFNEGWGQFNANKTAQWVKKLDPSRLVDHASGWFDQGGGDFVSKHNYFRALKPLPPEDQRAMILSEFGGYVLNLEGHLWEPGKTFGYRRFNTSEELTEAYTDLIEKQLLPWAARGLSGAVFTQLTDVEIETNGFLTYDRKVVKMNADRVRTVHDTLLKMTNHPTNHA